MFGTSLSQMACLKKEGKSVTLLGNPNKLYHSSVKTERTKKKTIQKVEKLAKIFCLQCLPTTRKLAATRANAKEANFPFGQIS